MAALVIAEMAVIPGQALDSYRALAGRSVAAHGGYFLARGVEKSFVEGDTTYPRVAVIAFPSLDKARDWYRSEDYAQALKIMDQAMTRNLYLLPLDEPKQASQVAAFAELFGNFSAL